MPLPLTVSCFSKIQIGFTFLVLAEWVVPEKGPLNGCVCVCVCTLILNGRVKELVECLAKLGSSGKWMVSQCVCVCVY